MSFAQRSLPPLLPRGSSTRPPEPHPASYRCIRQGRSGQGDQDCPSSRCSLRLGQCIPQPHPGCDCERFGKLCQNSTLLTSTATNWQQEWPSGVNLVTGLVVFYRDV